MTYLKMLFILLFAEQFLRIFCFCLQQKAALLKKPLFYQLLERSCVFPPLGNTSAMESLEQALLDKLMELETASKNLATAEPKPNLMRLFGEIENLAGRLPQSSNPSLLHYLQRKSYQKARRLLQGENPESETPEAGKAKCAR